MEKDKIKEELETKLNKIGWRLEHAGCGHFRLVNNANEQTSFLYASGELRLEGGGGNYVFGNTNSGSLNFNLKRCAVELLGEDKKGKQFVSICPKAECGKNHQSIFVSFYSH